jgi:CCR4-NOT transcriptional complex subunit CAF120
MNPYAQQQAMMAAQMAYQSSMYMAMSQAGSQVGTPDGNMASPGAFDGRASPMMTPNPYMSMYGGYAPSMAGFSGGMPGMMGPGSPLAYPPTGSVMGGNQAPSPSAANQSNYGDRKQDERR